MDTQLDGLRVLLVEAMPDQQRLYLKILERDNAEVTLECDGTSAVRAARRKDFDVIVMDLKMPGINGIEATLRLRANNFAGPIVAFTANGDAETESMWFQAGCSAFLKKSTAHTQLAKTIRSEFDKVTSESASC